MRKEIFRSLGEKATPIFMSAALVGLSGCGKNEAMPIPESTSTPTATLVARTHTPILKPSPTVESTRLPTPMPTSTPHVIQATPENTPSPAPSPDCISINPHEQQMATVEFDRSYQEWKKKYIASTNTDKLRVVRPENNNDTVSEGMAYGMILAPHTNDKNTFDGLWNFTKAHFNQNGVMSWKVEANGNVPDKNSATDADLDMAYALIVADRKWGGYGEDAKQLINNIMEHSVEKGTYILKPGDGWGGSDVTNPSYFSPAYYEVFKEYSGDARWDKVAETSRSIIDTVHEKRKGAKTGLLPNWTSADGNPVPWMGELNDKYTYDATRIPLRQAMAAVWFCDKPEVANHATTQLTRINSFFEKIDPSQIVDGYTLDGAVVGKYHNAAFVAPVAIAALVSNNQAYRKAILEETIKLSEGGYYNDSLRALTLLFLSGKMQSS